MGPASVSLRTASHATVPLKRKSPAPRYAQLADRRWLLERMADGASVYAVAKELRTGTRTIYHALRRHGLTWPPPTADPVERLDYIDDDENPGSGPRSGSSTRPRRWRRGRVKCETVAECRLQGDALGPIVVVVESLGRQRLLRGSRHCIVGGEQLRFVHRLVGVMHGTQQLKVDRVVDRRRRPADRRQ